MHHYRDKEHTLQRSHKILFGTTKIRNGKCDKVYCNVCEYSNDVQCLFDILRAAEGSKIRLKYPCGKAYKKYKETKN